MLAALVAAWALDRNTSAPACDQRVAWVSRSCGSAAVPHRRHHDGQRPGRPPPRCRWRGHRRGQPAGRVRLGTVSEHDVQQQHRRPRGPPPASASRSSRTVGSIIGCGRPRVNASSPRSTITCPRPVSRGTPWTIASGGSPRSGAERDVGSDRHPASRRRRSSPRRPGCRRRTGRAAHPRPATASGSGSHVGQAGTDTPSTASRSRVAAVMSGRPGPSSTVLVGVPAAAAAASTRSAVAGCGGLEISTMWSVPGSASSIASAVSADCPPTACRQVAAAQPEHRRHRHPGLDPAGR